MHGATCIIAMMHSDLAVTFQPSFIIRWRLTTGFAEGWTKQDEGSPRQTNIYFNNFCFMKFYLLILFRKLLVHLMKLVGGMLIFRFY